jgi:mannose-1-phosphate guanylyltransferase
LNDGLKTFAVLLAGGTGTRLWPVSREQFPKQLVRFIGKDSLVQSTLKRLSPALDPEQVKIVCGEEHFHEIRRHMSDIGVAPDGKVICEPCGRNTAPAILLGVFSLLKDERDAIVFVFPADHVIGDINVFHEKIAAAHRLAGQGYIVTFGIQPHYPETGYGYIEGAESVSEGALAIRRFVEKPDRRTAESYLAAGNFFWNSGMFAFKASVMVDEYRRSCPQMVDSMEQMIKKEIITPEDYHGLPDISIDVAIMEQTEKGVVLPSDFGWSDIGSWKSLYDFLPKDSDRNVIDGDVITKGTENCFILGRDRLIATNHIKNMVIVETPDSVFVSDLDTSRDVKQIVTELKTSGREEFKTHRTVHHPWGTVTVLSDTQDSKVERMVVYPKGICERDASEMNMSLTVVAGSGLMTTNGREQTLGNGVTFQITPKDVVKITNRRADALVCIVVKLPVVSNQLKAES